MLSGAIPMGSVSPSGVGKQWIAVCNVHDLISYALPDPLTDPMINKELYNLSTHRPGMWLREYLGWPRSTFPILQETNEYPMPTQAKIVSACGVMHNFIRTYDPDEVLSLVSQKLWTLPLQMPGGVMVLENLWARDLQSFKQREDIAKAMWRGLPAGSWRREGMFRHALNSYSSSLFVYIREH